MPAWLDALVAGGTQIDGSKFTHNDFALLEGMIANKNEALKKVTSVTIKNNNSFVPKYLDNLTNALGNNQNLQIFCVTHLDVGNLFAHEKRGRWEPFHTYDLAGCRNLTVLDLTATKIDDEGMDTFAGLVGHHQKLTTLNLSKNRITDAGVATLVTGLEKNRTLTELNLSGNKITDAGADALIAMLKKNKTLLYLDLSDNNISPEKLQTIKQHLKNNHAYAQVASYTQSSAISTAKTLIAGGPQGAAATAASAGAAVPASQQKHKFSEAAQNAIAADSLSGGKSTAALDRKGHGL